MNPLKHLAPRSPHERQIPHAVWLVLRSGTRWVVGCEGLNPDGSKLVRTRATGDRIDHCPRMTFDLECWTIVGFFSFLPSFLLHFSLISISLSLD